jgi:hypothetical protein
MATASHTTLNYALTFAGTLTKSFQLIHRIKESYLQNHDIFILQANNIPILQAFLQPTVSYVCHPIEIT